MAKSNLPKTFRWKGEDIPIIDGAECDVDPDRCFIREEGELGNRYGHVKSDIAIRTYAQFKRWFFLAPLTTYILPPKTPVHYSINRWRDLKYDQSHAHLTTKWRSRRVYMESGENRACAPYERILSMHKIYEENFWSKSLGTPVYWCQPDCESTFRYQYYDTIEKAYHTTECEVAGRNTTNNDGIQWFLTPDEAKKNIMIPIRPKVRRE